MDTSGIQEISCDKLQRSGKVSKLKHVRAIMKASASYFSRHCFLLLCTLLLLNQLFSSIAYADGGAPQLAYVAGAAKGISIIDIAQRRVRGTITLAESPQTLLLSQNASALYLAQPLSGKVTVIGASTGRTLCSVHLPGQPVRASLAVLGDVAQGLKRGEQVVRGAAVQPSAVGEFAQPSSFGLPGDALEQGERSTDRLDH